MSTKDEGKLSIKSYDIEFCILTMFGVLVYFVVFGLVFVVAIAAMIMSVSSIQNRIRIVCVACFVISSSIFGQSSFFSMLFYRGFF